MTTMNNPLRIFDDGGATDIGKVRSHNEDSFLVRSDTGVWAVADGMGGHDAGAFASATVVDALQMISGPASVDDLMTRCRKQLEQANRHLLDFADVNGGIVIGATVAVLLAHEGYYACLWSGDSRIYLVRDGRIAQISRDHTEVAELVAEGVLSEEEALTWPRRNVITRAVGVHDELELDVAQGILQKGDAFVICSDGLTAHVKDVEILDHVVAGGAQSACDELVALTMERGAIDNVTVVVMRYVPRGSTVVFPDGNAPLPRWGHP
jgi:protein phosphatase